MFFLASELKTYPCMKPAPQYQRPWWCIDNIHHLTATCKQYYKSHFVGRENTSLAAITAASFLGHVRQSHPDMKENLWRHGLLHAHFYHTCIICMLTRVCIRITCGNYPADSKNNCQPVCIAIQACLIMCVCLCPFSMQSVSVKSCRPCVFNDTRAACFRQQRRSN